MKKTYQKPEMLIAHLATQSIIAASPKGKQVFGDSSPASASNPYLSRHSIWDDEDEEEEW